jgi:hypothetical protein
MSQPHDVSKQTGESVLRHGKPADRMALCLSSDT